MEEALVSSLIQGPPNFNQSLKSLKRSHRCDEYEYLCSHINADSRSICNDEQKNWYVKTSNCFLFELNVRT